MRNQAVQVLTRTLNDGLTIDQAIDQVMKDGDSSRSWMQEISSGTLRWKGRLDFILNSVSLKKKPSGWLRKILLTSAYQLIAQDRINRAAVVNETVDEIREKEGEAPSRFANAVLRKISDQAVQWKDLDGDTAEWASLPEWLWKKICAQQGLAWAKAFALACLERPETWILEGPSLKSSKLGGAAKSGGAVFHHEGFQEGKFIVQDISNQVLVSEICSEIKKLSGNLPLSALDLCAAPGGKTIALSWNGFSVFATDQDTRRLQLIQENLDRLAKNPDLIAMGKITLVERKSVADLPLQDLVWVDAPCTGTGIIRRHPEIRWNRKESDLLDLTVLQKKLLLEGWEKVKPGGYLVYSVCSILKEEGPDLVRAAGLSEGLLGARKIRDWFLVPQEEPHGDGFWGVLLGKSGK